MRSFPFAVANLVAVVAISATTLVAVGAGREATFKADAAKLEQRWSTMRAEGVSTAALDQLEASLESSPYQAPGWSPSWWNDPGSNLIDSLRAGTTEAWNDAVSGAEVHAVAAIAGWDLMAEHDAAFLPAASRAAFVQWQSKFAAATTPGAMQSLTAQLNATTLADARAGATEESMVVANMPATLRTLLLMTDQAAAEAIPGSKGFLTTYHQIATAAAGKPSGAHLATLGVAVASLNTTVGAALRSHACGHDVPSGKAIVINLTVQEVVFYQDGCALQAAPVTSGRNLERTPTGTFHVFRKVSPVLFTSWAPRSSPFWYPPERANYALEFTVVRAGIYLHDAPWEANSAYGPGSENTDSASHGCVHAPTTVMSWAYTWAPVGTPVIVTY
ncbi:MAG TPA: L,D-transpeptidase [Candidatus Dormibacteraeota bacterium]